MDLCARSLDFSGFCSGSSVAASKILCAKTGQEAYLGLILIHTKFEKKT